MTKRTRTILVVDDEPGTVEVMLAVLSDARYRVTGAHNGREALAAMTAEVPDLVLLDLLMPVLDGAETLRAIRAAPEYAKVGVVMMSGMADTMVRRRCRGHDAFLRKPFALDALLSTIEQVLKERAGQASGSRRKRPV